MIYRPWCKKCGWYKWGNDSWNGSQCKCQTRGRGVNKDRHQKHRSRNLQFLERMAREALDVGVVPLEALARRGLERYIRTLEEMEASRPHH